MTLDQLKNHGIKLLGAAFVAMLMSLPVTTAAQANVIASIDISSQRMNVTVNGFHYATWKVSTAGRGYRTPTGSWRPKWMAKMQHVADAALDLLLRRLCDSRHQLHHAPWPAGLARLHPPASAQCPQTVHAGQAARHEEHADQDPPLTGKRDQAPGRQCSGAL